jgi:dTDP-4-dehydrorhamnose 3,5-epimerase
VQVIELEQIPNGPKIFKIASHLDNRGTFDVLFEDTAIRHEFPGFPKLEQVNMIRAFKSSLRGFHGTKNDSNHWKIVTCISGRVKEAYLDIRPKSATFGKVAAIELNGMQRELIVVPPGFAHAMESLEENSIIIYATNVTYLNQREIDIFPLDSACLGLWSIDTILSERDLKAPTFKNLLDLNFFEERQ